MQACQAKHPAAPQARYEQLDALAQRDRLCSLLRAERPSLVVVDVGGIRALADVMELLETVLAAVSQPEQAPASSGSAGGEVAAPHTLVLVKSEKLVTELLKHRQREQQQRQLAPQPRVLACPTGWWSSLRERWNNEDQELLTSKLLSRRGAGLTGAQCRFLERRCTPDGCRVICGYHNYATGGCTVTARQTDHTECPYDHEHCHFCLGRGHTALQCEALRAAQQRLLRQRQAKERPHVATAAPPSTVPAGVETRVTLEARITQALSRIGQPKPTVRAKEIAESIAFVKRIRQACSSNSAHPAFKQQCAATHLFPSRSLSCKR